MPAAQVLTTCPVDHLRGVGPRLAEHLARLDIFSVADVLFHLPLRYQDRTCVQSIATLEPGESLQVVGQILAADIHYGRRRALLVALTDPDSEPGIQAGLWLRFFHFSPALLRQLQPGEQLRCFGDVRSGPRGLEMIHPELDFPAQNASTTPENEVLTPIYPSTRGISQLQWRALTEQALNLLAAQPELLPPLLPETQLARLGLPPLPEALRLLHRPPRELPTCELLERRHPAFQRLALEELIAHQLALRALRAQFQAQGAPPLPGTGQLRTRLHAQLGFTLTAAQRRVLEDIAADLAGSQPMLRLLQGDVGSGKTVVAALAATQALESGAQVALMAPTELLAEQHRRSLERWFAPLGIEIPWLTGRHKGAERDAILTGLHTGQTPLIIGTHALFQDEVRFARLGLVIIDEQHRFGVHQRLRLRAKGEAQGQLPHQLIMTATPIPRSLAMVAYADLDLSVIDERPPGRQPIQTLAVPDTRRGEVIERLCGACEGGRQAYWVCTLVEESEALQCQAAEATAAQLRQDLPQRRIGLVHGRMKPQEREPVMRAFADGALDVLVATTVIEVGVDVPNASVMIIENPERLGLAQLHQLRGRVGRGTLASFCLLLYHPPLTAQAHERLRLLRAEDSGFRIADADLRLRGAGELLGARQSGHPRLRLADPARDQELVKRAREWAITLWHQHPQLVDPLIERWLGSRREPGLV